MYHALDNQMEVDNETIEDITTDDESVDEDENEVDKAKRGMVYPLRVTKEEKSRHVNLLLTEKDTNWHYSAIKNFSGFLRVQYSKTNHKSFYCYTCLHGFQAKKGEKSRKQCKLLEEHNIYCKKQKPQRVTYPKDGVTKFTNIQKMLKQPFVGYADFECILKKESEGVDVTTGITETARKQVKFKTHEPASYFTKFVSIDPQFALPEEDNFQFPQTDTYVGEDAAEKFLDYVQAVAKGIFKKYIVNKKEMIYTDEDKKKFEEATHCHICEKELYNENDVIERKQCHILLKKKDEDVDGEEEEGEEEEEKDGQSKCTSHCGICKEKFDKSKHAVIVRDHCHILGVSNVKCN